MKCPACGGELAAQDFGVRVDACAQCQSLWFDLGELARLDEENEGLGAALEAALTHPHAERRGPRACPHCSLALQTHRYSRAKEVHVDECYRCGGFFLDAGELAAIRRSHMSDDDLRAYQAEIASSVPDYLQMLQDTRRERQRTEAIGHLGRTLARWLGWPR